MQTGRVEIFTDVEEITSENIIQVLGDAWSKHIQNASKINYLLDFDAGIQPQVREKTQRKEIDIHCVDNVAHEAVAFNESYHWGNPITWIQRGEKDSGKTVETDAIALLNECYSAESVESKTQQLGRFIEICGIGFVFIDVKTDYEDGDSYFTYDVLDPRYTFVVKSSSLGHKVKMGVTYCTDTSGVSHFTCFTDKARYEITHQKIKNGKKKDEWNESSRSGEVNPLSAIPIIECIRSYDRMGCFEREIDDMLALNLLESDVCNATDETVQSIWLCTDVEFPEDEDGNVIKPEMNDWLQVFTSKDGKTPTINALSSNFDYAGNIAYISQKREYILEKLCIPSRNNNSGGSTGVAMNSATGWNAAENQAMAVENIAIGWKQEELKVVLKAIKKNHNVPSDSPLLSLRVMDVKPNIKRNKNYELSVKSNFISTLINCGFNGKHVIDAANTFPDPNQVWEDSKENVEAYQKSIWESKKNTSSDIKAQSDDVINQIENSPFVDKSRS